MAVETVGAPQYVFLTAMFSFTMLSSGAVVNNYPVISSAVHSYFDESSDSSKSYTIDGAVSTSNIIVINDQLQENLNKLEEILRLPANWNGNNAAPLSPDMILKAKEILLGLSIQPEVFPTAADSIQFEYDGLNNSYLEFQISEKEIADIYLIDINGEEREFSVPCTSAEVEKVVTEFYG